MHLRLTAQDLGLATLLFGGAGLILLLPLLLLFRDPAFQRAALALAWPLHYSGVCWRQ